MGRKRVRVRVDGRVQGVFFRQSTRKMAEEMGVRGWVRNLPDGGVEAVFEGEDAAVDALVRWCRRGPPTARVDRIEVVEEPYAAEFQGFRIRR